MTEAAMACTMIAAICAIWLAYCLIGSRGLGPTQLGAALICTMVFLGLAIIFLASSRHHQPTDTGRLSPDGGLQYF